MNPIINWVFPAEVFKNPFVQCPYLDLGCCAVLFIGWGGGHSEGEVGDSEAKPEKRRDRIVV